MLNTSNIKHPQHQIIRAIVHCSMLFALNGTPITINWLVVLTILKNMKVNGKDYPKYIMEIKFMFETTNQLTLLKYYYYYNYY